MEIILALGIIIIVGFMVVFLCKAIDVYYDKKREKFANKHPKYMKFNEIVKKLLDEKTEIWNSTMPNCRKEVEYCIKEMKYYPEHSEKYQYLEAKLDVARREIEKCQEEYDKKENEIYLFVQANKDAIEELRNDAFGVYVSWVKRYNLDKVE